MDKQSLLSKILSMQNNLFGEIEPTGITFNVAAEIAGVSPATIRNWVKTGYLKQVKRGLVSNDSLEDFMENVAGNDKLTSRANKLKKDKHDHAQITDYFNSKLENYDSGLIGSEYENRLSNSYRNKEGIYYTPDNIVKDMFKGLEIKPLMTFLDPCCGCGNFLIEAIKSGVHPDNIYGFDTDSNAVKITKKRILSLTGLDSPNIQDGNFLLEAEKLRRKNRKFDLIFTNPPWGKKLKKSHKQQLAQIYVAGNSFDTSSLFFFASSSLLKENGNLGFLVQEAFFNIAVFEDARRKILEFNLERLVDYGKIFKGLLTKAQAFVISNSNLPQETEVKCTFDGNNFGRRKSSFIINPKSIFNFWITNEESEAIEQIYSHPHNTLKENAKWALGIVTGNNSKFCKSIPASGYVPIFKGSDITKNGLKSPTNYIPEDFSLFQQVAPKKLYQVEEKIIYKFISSKLVFFHDTKQKYILNSANLVIPSEQLEISIKQLCDLFNSKIMNWLYKSLFNTHKVLRSDLEVLPIHYEYFQTHKKFQEESYLEYLGLEKTTYGTYRIKK